MTVCVTVRENDNEKENQKKNQKKDTNIEKKMYLEPQESIFEMMMRQEETFLSFCGGKGMCGRCRIQYLTPAPIPKAEERKYLTPEELRQGIRLACLAYPKEDCEIVPLYQSLYRKTEKGEPEEILSVYETSLQEMEYKDHYQKTTHQDTRYQGFKDQNCRYQQIIAVDLGTTTIVLQRIRVMDNAVLEERRIMNPQRIWGADVISRMEASIHGKRERLQQIVVDALEKIVDELQSAEQDLPLFIAANTVMEHLLMAEDMTHMSAYPFTPVTLEQTQINIGKYQATLLPAISTFVGADITAGIYATQLGKEQKGIRILLDLGTNGEMVISNGERMIATATAAGPAFEGRLSGELKGSDLIALVAELLDNGVVDETGLLQEPYFSTGYEIQGEIIHQEDIRALQTAKAAVYAGLRILLEKIQVKIDEIDQVYLAGGFGYYLDVKKAARIGLLPEKLQEKTVAVGNTSLLGAYLYGKAQHGQRINPPKEVMEIKKKTEVINLAEQEVFESYFISALNFPS